MIEHVRKIRVTVLLPFEQETIQRRKVLLVFLVDRNISPEHDITHQLKKIKIID